MVCMSFAICGVMTCWSPFRFTFLMACAMQGHCGRKFHTSFTVGNLWQGMGMAFGCQLLLAFPRAKQQLLQWKLQESYSLHTFNVHLSKIFDVSGRHSSWALAGPGSCHVFGHGWTRCKGSSLNTKGIISRNVKPVKPFQFAILQSMAGVEWPCQAFAKYWWQVSTCDWLFCESMEFFSMKAYDNPILGAKGTWQVRELRKSQEVRFLQWKIVCFDVKYHFCKVLRFRVFVLSRVQSWRFRVFAFCRRHPRGRDTDFVCTVGVDGFFWYCQGWNVRSPDVKRTSRAAWILGWRSCAASSSFWGSWDVPRRSLPCAYFLLRPRISWPKTPVWSKKRCHELNLGWEKMAA